MELTSEQNQVVQHEKGHAIVSAVAGSGKTQTMVSRIKHLIDQGVRESDILVVMYNKSAQLDFLKRLSLKLNKSCDDIQVKTFHSLGFALSRLLVQQGKMPDFKLMTQGWQLRKLVQNALESLKTNAQLINEIDAELIDQYENYLTLLKSDIDQENIHKLLNQGLGVRLSQAESKRINAFFKAYESLRISQRLRTFDDLIYEPIKLLSENPDFKKLIPWQYQYVIIDEYQDINSVQQTLVKLFVNDQTEVMVVGDVDQTIYEWRGSKPYYMLKGFEEEFGKVSLYQLSNTFRYGHKLSLAANYIISRNKQRLKNLCISHQETPTTEIEVNFGHSVDQLPEMIDHWLKANPQYSLTDVAVLVRKYSSLALFELALLKHKVPYQILGHEGVTSDQVTLSLIGYLGLYAQANFFQTLDLEERKIYLRAMLMCPSVYLRQNILETMVNQIANCPQEGAQILLRLSANFSLKPFQSERLRARAYLWQEITQMMKVIQADIILEQIVETLEYSLYFKSKQYSLGEAFDKGMITDAMIQYARSVNLSASDFLEHFSQLRAKASSTELHDHGISILSIHRAKGLEWPKVVLLDATERAYFGAGEPHLSEESERRLFYVAMTRAKHSLTIVGGNDQLKLTQWYQGKRNGYPYDLKLNHSVRFLYEMNYDQVCSEVNWISQKGPELTEKQPFTRLRKGKLFKDYLALMGI
ncbi:ATP-dependent helicase [Thiotrichales bacterium 19S9-12]|nr:ATP-dependent helicase [Thiotrichales bacterium 19S9-11]MCF6812594.1 ATP-dependent helicase [Thiotrichales bacterium 19S9-12]